MKQLCLIIAISALPTLGFGQFIGDSVIVYIDNRVEINVAVPDFEDLKSSDAVIKSLNGFRDLLPEIQDQLSSDEADLVRYSESGTLTIEPGDPKIIFLQKDGKMSNTGFRDRAIVAGKDFKILITTTDLSKISDMALSTCFEKVIKLLPEQTHWSKNISYECIDGETTLLDNMNNKVDMLELQAGVGAGLIKNNWVTDISLGVGLYFNKKGMVRGAHISSNMIFDFATEGNMNINTFLNLGFSWDLERKSDQANMLGLELGYLIVKQGDLFGENTFKFGVNWSPAKHINVSPQLYVTDNFKQAFPGIRVGFGF
jgi:hypothetical protein